MLQAGDPILVIKPKWLLKILTGAKTLEIRGSVCKKDIGTTVYLSSSGSACISGMAKFAGCTGPLTKEQFRALKNQHQVHDEADIERVFATYSKVYAWKFEEAVHLDAIPYQVTRGTVVWRKYAPCVKNV